MTVERWTDEMLDRLDALYASLVSSQERQERILDYLLRRDE